MGTVQGKRVLVVMTNGDICYLEKSTAIQLEKRIEEGKNATFKTVNVKTGAVTIIVLQHVSTLVDEVRNA